MGVWKLLLITLFSCCCCLRRASSSGSFPAVCAGSRTPVVLETTLAFCGYSGLISCCDSVDDAALRDAFESLDVAPDGGCSDIVKRILCERCIPSSRSVPLPPPDPSNTAANSRIPPRCVLTPAPPSTSAGSSSSRTMCLESISDAARGSFLDMVAHPDGSDRAFLTTNDGKIWLASIPAPGSGDTLRFDTPFPFLDLTDQLVRLMSVAFHPQFAANGRFFVSYTCDTAASPVCRRSSSSAAATAGNNFFPSRYQLIVAEFSASKSKATRADASEVRRLFTLGLPYTSSSDDQQQHGGQILFRRPSDEYLYLMTGHGDHLVEVSNDSTSVLGKIIRLNVDNTINVSGQSGGTASSSHSNRSAGTTPMVFAEGFNSPRGCSFDSERPSYLFCANVEQQQYESVYLICGPSVNAINATSLVFGSSAHPVSIVGGLVYRGSADPSLNGRYLHIHDDSAWAAVEVPASSGRYVSVQIPSIRCSHATAGGDGVQGRVVSFGQDNNNDAFLIATGGIYRVVAPSLCRAARHSEQPVWLGIGGTIIFVAVLFYYCYPMRMNIFAGCCQGGGQPATNCNGWFSCCASIMCCCNTSVTNIINGPPGAGAGAAEQTLDEVVVTNN